MTKIQEYMLTKECGFVTDKDMPEIVAMAPMVPMLIRCGGNRYVVPAKDVASTLVSVRASGDYVRDVSFPAQEMECARNARTDEHVQRTRAKLVDHPPSRVVAQARKTGDYHSHFNENDCGGVFDGTGVVSDCDPGL